MKLRVRFLQLPIRFDAERLAAEVAAIPESAWRAHPRGYPGNDALTLITTGGDPDSDARAGPMEPTPHLLACPYLMEVLETLGATWGRSRLMRLSGDAEVTPHIDTDYYWRDHMRVHVPIVTQPTVRFICGDEEVNMAAGECWVFDTWSLHSVHNDATRARIHLVADTVGGDGLLDLLEQAKAPKEERSGWAPVLKPPRGGAPATLAYESRNAPQVMTPWELRDHLGFLLAEVAPGDPKMGPVFPALNRLRTNWHALWARSGDDESALGGASGGMDADARVAPEVRSGSGPAAQPRPAPSPRPPMGRDEVFDRPIFIVSSPRSGSTLLFETLSKSPDLMTVGGESHRLIETIPAISPASRGWDSNRLDGSDVTAAIAVQLRQGFYDSLRDRSGAARQPGPVRMLEKTPKNALRVPFLAQIFPEARFIYLHRDPRPTLASMMEAWASGGFRTYPQLPGWTGRDWSLLLTPGWRELIGAPLNKIVATQWATTTRILLDDLSALPADRWRPIRYEAFIADPQQEISRLCQAMELRWDRPLDPGLPLARHTVSTPRADKWRVHEAAIDAVSSIWSSQNERSLSVLGESVAS